MTDETARLTGDVVLVGERDGESYVLLIERGHPPFEGYLAFPGGHVDVDETTEDAARRELAEEVGLTVDALTLIGVYADPGRDPRGRYATWAYLATVDGLPEPTAGDDAAAARWIALNYLFSNTQRLAFDHDDILVDAVAKMHETWGVST